MSIHTEVPASRAATAPDECPSPCVRDRTSRVRPTGGGAGGAGRHVPDLRRSAVSRRADRAIGHRLDARWLRAGRGLGEVPGASAPGAAPLAGTGRVRPGAPGLPGFTTPRRCSARRLRARLSAAGWRRSDRRGERSPDASGAPRVLTGGRRATAGAASGEDPGRRRRAHSPPRKASRARHIGDRSRDACAQHASAGYRQPKRSGYGMPAHRRYA